MPGGRQSVEDYGCSRNFFSTVSDRWVSMATKEWNTNWVSAGVNTRYPFMKYIVLDFRHVRVLEGEEKTVDLF